MRGKSLSFLPVWHELAENPTGQKTTGCAGRLAVYPHCADVLRGGHPASTGRHDPEANRIGRGRTWSGRRAYGIWPLGPRYSGWRRAMARLTAGRRSGSHPALSSARLGLLCWTETRSRAPSSVAWSVVSPPKTGTFGNNRSSEQLDSFISPLTCPLRDSGRGPFSVFSIRYVGWQASAQITMRGWNQTDPRTFSGTACADGPDRKAHAHPACRENGETQCSEQLPPSRPSHSLAFRLVVTQPPARPSSVVRQAQGSRPRPTVRLQPARPSGLVSTCCIAKQTQANADLNPGAKTRTRPFFPKPSGRSRPDGFLLPGGLIRRPSNANPETRPCSRKS